MQDRKRNGEPVEEIQLPPHSPTKGRSIEDPKPRSKQRADDVENPDAANTDDETGEMASAGQDLGVTVDDERNASSIEDSGAKDEEGSFD